MMRKLRNISALLLCGIFLYNIMGYMVVFSSLQMILRQQFFARLSNLPEAAFSAIALLMTLKAMAVARENITEIKADRKMYDVICQKDKSITCFCLREQKEEEFILRSGIFTGRPGNKSSYPEASRLILVHIIKSALLPVKKENIFCPETDILSGI